MNSYRIQNEFVIHHYQVSLSELFHYFTNYDSMFFFYPKYSRNVVETAVKKVIDEINNYNPCKMDQNLMTSVIEDIELFQSRNPHPSLEDSDFLNHLEIITEQIEQQTNFYFRNKLPINHQCQIVTPKWIGDSLIFGLRIF